jgi:hypothetical protein
MPITLAKPAIVSLDAAIDQLASLEVNWDQNAAPRIDRRILTSARTWLRNLSDDSLIIPPAVVPLSSGVLQFEWHVDSRILEIEFESFDTIHFLKWDPVSAIEDEGTFPSNDLTQSDTLIAWVRHG